MNKALLALAALALAVPAAYSQACGDEGRYFHLAPPSYTISSARKHAVHRMARAIRWYHEHLGDKPLSTLDGKLIP